MTRRGIALVATAAALAGCGGGSDSDDGSPSPDKPPEASVGRFLGTLPLGYREAPAPRPDVEQAFKRKVARDFGASEVVTRNVYLGAQFVAGEIAVRTRRPLPIATIADKISPRHIDVRTVKIAGKRAHVVTAVDRAGEPEVTVVETAGPVVLVVTAQRYPLARKLAARFVR